MIWLWLYLVGWLVPDPWTVWRVWRQRHWLRFKARQAARISATAHMATIARAIYQGSTEHYTLMTDLPRVENSTDVRWW